ncbi:tyrosine-type recombinase/integrase [Peribacillus cavernae]|uniref:tyrosine-type recombinase/integrase n=1 Tax=Peribacillus cavernae TaxID=1674310 RepID=UPI001FEBDC66|nr:tyrosine-type recombinase/integrase [Peribacillus cavernae]MDQ0221289.1 integrase/recombinase XerD [Peribacillus cavernae]
MEAKNDPSSKKSTVHAFSIWLTNQGKSESTIKTYTGVLSQFSDWSKMEVNQAEAEDVQAYLDYLDYSNKSAGTIEKHFIALSMFFKYLGSPQLLANIERKEKEQKKEVPDTLNVLEQAALLKEIERDGNLRNIAIVYTLLHTGIRVSELCDLNCNDIIAEKDRIYISVRNSSGEIDRVVPLSSDAAMHLENYQNNKKEETGVLFISSYNQRITPRSVQYMLKKYDVHPHKLRHTFCKQLVDKGVNLQTVSQLAGHKDLNIAKRYLNEDKSCLDDAIDMAFSK